MKREDRIKYASQALSSRQVMASINQDELGDIKSEDEAKAAVDKGKQAVDDV